MDKNEILESNKLIAEFMGFKESIIYHDNKKYDYVIPNGFTLIKETETTIESEWCEILMEQDNCMVEDLLFNSSWDWLIPVLSKIDDICGIDLHEWDASIDDALCTKNISIAWRECVGFIKWYNKNKK